MAKIGRSPPRATVLATLPPDHQSKEARGQSFEAGVRPDAMARLMMSTRSSSAAVEEIFDRRASHVDS
jgi:hypothetical protein